MCASDPTTMGRGSGSSRAGGGGMFTKRSSSSSSSKSSTPAKTTQPVSSPQASKAPTPAPTPAATATGAPPQRSMMSEIGSNIIGTAGGVVLGHTIMGMFRGGEGKEMSPAESQAFVEKKSQGPCSIQFKMLSKCLEANQNETGACN